VRFEEAMLAMREGKKVICPDWKKCILSLVDNKLEFQYTGDDSPAPVIVFDMSSDDLLAEDWEIVE
jgi:hypothetical protein